jgi:hypothetical protein
VAKAAPSPSEEAVEVALALLPSEATEPATASAWPPLEDWAKPLLVAVPPEAAVASQMPTAVWLASSVASSTALQTEVALEPSPSATAADETSAWPRPVDCASPTAEALPPPVAEESQAAAALSGMITPPVRVTGEPVSRALQFEVACEPSPEAIESELALALPPFGACASATEVASPPASALALAAAVPP